MANARKNEATRERVQLDNPVLHSVMLSLLCVISFWLITHMLAQVFSVSRDDDLLGGMWAVVATVFVYRYRHEQSAAAALSRLAATALSFALCFIYLLIFPFHPGGMAALIGLGAVAMTLLGRPDDVITTGITTAVVMCVAAVSPHHAWRQPILRVVDTAVGVAVGVGGSWIVVRLPKRRYRASQVENGLGKTL